MDDLLGSILNKMTKPPTVGEQQKKAMQSKSSDFINLSISHIFHSFAHCFGCQNNEKIYSNDKNKKEYNLRIFRKKWVDIICV